MAQKIARRPYTPIDLDKLKHGLCQLPLVFTWADLMAVVGALGSEAQIRQLVMNKWKWIEATTMTQKTVVQRKGKLVGGRPRKIYQKTHLGKEVW